MQLLTSLLLLAQQLSLTSGLRVIDNGMDFAVYGPEDTVVDYAILAADQKAALPAEVQEMSTFDKFCLIFSSPSVRLQLRMRQ